MILIFLKLCEESYIIYDFHFRRAKAVAQIIYYWMGILLLIGWERMQPLKHGYEKGAQSKEADAK